MGRRGTRLVAALALSAAWLTFGALTVIYLGTALVQMWVRALVLLPRAGVWLFVALREGMDWWSIAGRAGAALSEVIVTPETLSWLVGLELVGAAALFGLHRLFGREGEDARRGERSTEVK